MEEARGRPTRAGVAAAGSQQAAGFPQPRAPPSLHFLRPQLPAGTPGRNLEEGGISLPTCPGK